MSMELDKIAIRIFCKVLCYSLCSLWWKKTPQRTQREETQRTQGILISKQQENYSNDFG